MTTLTFLVQQLWAFIVWKQLKFVSQLFYTLFQITKIKVKF